MSSSRGHSDCSSALLDAKVEMDAQDRWGNTPLHLSVRRRKTQAAMLLLHAGADFDIVNCVSVVRCDY